MKKPYIITATINQEEMDKYGKVLDTKTMNPLVFLANQDVENGIDLDSIGDIDDFNCMAFLYTEYLDKIKKFFKESGCSIDIIEVDEYVLNNELKFIKMDEKFEIEFKKYYVSQFTINEILDKINKKIPLNEFDKHLLKEKS